MVTDTRLVKFVELMSKTRHFVPGFWRPVDALQCCGKPMPNGLVWLFQKMEAASFNYWHFCSFAHSMEVQRGMASVRDDVGLDEVNAQSVARQIKASYWNDCWIPLFVIEHNSICVDLDPTEFGVVGQIICVSDDSEERTLVSNSIEEFCGSVVDAYELGSLKYRDDGAGTELHAVEDSLDFMWGA